MDLIDLVARWGLPLVLAAVILEQGGLPLPAAPLLVVAGALAGAGPLRAEQLLGIAVFGCLLADHVWFVIGRAHGRSVLGAVCRLSLSPDTCVRQTDDLIKRHGAPLLLVAKFIPGVSAVAIPTAAAMGMRYRRFLPFDVAGSLLWAGVYLGAGMIFSREVNRVLDSMSVIGAWALVIFAGLIVAYVLAKLLRRRGLRRLHKLVRISPEEAVHLLARESDVLIVDARSSLARENDPRALPRSILAGDGPLVEALPADARNGTVITFCTCPSEASAALLAEELIKAGYDRVRVLTGGAAAIAALQQVT
jgi:membrane protein DedA with SNARE-associated domain/rhodanese-related sulfurtransferase